MKNVLMETNVYSVKGKVLLVGSCLAEVEPEAYAELEKEYDQVYTLCLETTHINMAVTKLAAILATGQVTELTIASVDQSPHCTQMHYIMHEIERTLPEHCPVKQYVIVDGKKILVTQEAIALSKSFAKLTQK